MRVLKPRKEKSEGYPDSRKAREPEKLAKEKEVVEEPWWPPFRFDGRNALKSRMCINLRNCQYDLFRKIALEELNWRVVDWRNRVIERNPNALAIEEVAKDEDDGVASKYSGGAADSEKGSTKGQK